MKEIKESKIRVKKKVNPAKKKRDIFDSLSITRELEKSISISDELIKEKERVRMAKKRKLEKTILKLAVLIFFVVAISYIFWLQKTFEVTERADQAMLNTPGISVIEKDSGVIDFVPRSSGGDEQSMDVGIIIYPGEKIEPKSYANIARKLAQNGYPVSILKLRLNQPDLSFGKGTSLIESKKDIKRWYILAHANGANIAYKDALKIKNISGFVFMGAIPEGNDLNLVNMPVLSIWGTNDGLLDFSKTNEIKKRLPQSADYYMLEGGNSTNFADIELVSGDEEAVVSPSDQQTKTVRQILKFIRDTEENIH